MGVQSRHILFSVADGARNSGPAGMFVQVVVGVADALADGPGVRFERVDSRRSGVRIRHVALPVVAALAAFLGVATDASAGSFRAFDTAVGSTVHAGVQGAGSNDQAGYVVANAGDVNGDGIDDQLISAPNASVASRTENGAVYVVYGSRTGGQIDLANFGSADGYVIYGPASNSYIRKVANAGDVNGDGVPDALIGAATFSAGDGAAWVVYGRRAGTGLPPTAVDLNNGALPVTEGYRMTGITSGSCGESVDSTGDVNGDGVPDALIGCPNFDLLTRPGVGAVFVVYGRRQGLIPPTSSIDLSSFGSNDGYIDVGPTANAGLGTSVAKAGDVNGDDIPDSIIGAPSADDVGASGGIVYILYGRRAGTALPPPTGGSGNVLDTNPQSGEPFTVNDGYRISGPAPSATVGMEVANADDVDGDGVPDSLIADSNAFTQSGTVYVVYGRRAGKREVPSAVAAVPIQALSPEVGYELRGAVANDKAGFSVANVGDINSDGVPDAAIGAPEVKLNGHIAGEVYVVYGRRSGLLAPPTSTQNLFVLNDKAQEAAISSNGGFRIDGSTGYLGASVAGAGDQNGDGLPDVLSGDPFFGGGSFGFGRGRSIVTTVKPLAVAGRGSSEVGASSARLVATVSPGGLPLEYAFQFGTTPDLGTTTNRVALSGYGTETVSYVAAGLKPNTTYYYRVFATNQLGQTEIGETATFATKAGSSTTCQTFKLGNCNKPTLFANMKGSLKRSRGVVSIRTASGGPELASETLTIGRYAGLPASKRSARGMKVRLLTSGNAGKASAVKFKRRKARGRQVIASYTGTARIAMSIQRAKGGQKVVIGQIPKGVTKIDLRISRVRGPYIPARKRCVQAPVTSAMVDRAGNTNRLALKIKLCKAKPKK